MRLNYRDSITWSNKSLSIFSLSLADLHSLQEHLHFVLEEQPHLVQSAYEMIVQ